MRLVLAAGLLWNTPSNYYIRSHFGIKACAMCGGGACGGDEGNSVERGGEEGGDTETACIVDFSEEFPHLAPGEDGGYDTDDGGAMGGCGGCGGCVGAVVVGVMQIAGEVGATVVEVGIMVVLGVGAWEGEVRVVDHVEGVVVVGVVGVVVVGVVGAVATRTE